MARRKGGMEPHETPFPFWLPNFCLTPEKRRFTYDGRPWLIEMAFAFFLDAFIAVQKASQQGVTVLALLSAYYKILRKEWPAGAMYFFPTDHDVEELSKTKAGPLLEFNYFARECTTLSQVTLKKFRNGANLMFRGTVSEIRLKSASTDVVFYDEANQITPEALKMAKERTHASDVQWERHFSIPSVPGYGIDKTFQTTDQRHWTFQCKACRREFNLEDTFPECIAEKNGGPVLACPAKGCHRPVRVDEGRWVPKYPERKRTGFRLSQLLSPTVKLPDLLEDFEKTDRIGVFWRGRLGKPYIEAGGQVTADQVLELCGEHPNADTSTASTFFGVDVGRKKHWVAWAKNDGRPRLVGCGTEETMEAVKARSLSMKATRTVQDALPETEKAIEIAQSAQVRGRWWLCYYSLAKPEPAKWKEDDDRKFLRVDCNRTVALDYLVRCIREAKVVLPKRDRRIEEFAEHVAALVRVDETDPDTGEVRQSYISTGPDHFGHAASYGLLGLRSSPDMPAGFVRVG